MSGSPCRRIPVLLERDRLRSLHSISRKNVPFQCDFSSSAKQQTHRAHELHTRAFLHPKHSNMTRCRSTSPRHDSVQLVDEGHVEVFFFSFFGQMSFFSSLGGNEQVYIYKWCEIKDGASSRSAACLLDLSRCWPRRTREAEKRPARCCSCFNRCHISFKTLETDSQEGYFFSIPKAPD